ncbi:helix-turn-helix domain-containing protein [Kitasatospora sp. NBC_01539]|uniref:helix-turn-helix domain-containing protein n=1 Tax=Kitasatospora sp. NBC_01539 TaxID=2903577 RepID=UPI0038601F98
MSETPLELSRVAHALGTTEHLHLRLIADQNGPAVDPTLVALTVEEAARRLGIGRTKMYEFVVSGEIPSVKIGSLRRIPAEAVGAFLTKRLSAADLATAA